MSTQAPRGRNTTQITLFSPAKVNLYLRITGKRPDGYHELETVMVPLDFGDTITLQLRKTSMTLECDNPNLPVDETNLALRAATAMQETFQPERGVKIILQKRIPLAAGLAGGSASMCLICKGTGLCKHCGGLGVDKTRRLPCPDCGGQAAAPERQPGRDPVNGAPSLAGAKTVPCTVCQGTGRLPGTCLLCRGTGQCRICGGTGKRAPLMKGGDEAMCAAASYY